MRIICLDGQDYAGTGGALRGQEMALALRWMGHQVSDQAPTSLLPEMIHPGMADGIILTGTWHQLVLWRGKTSGIPLVVQLSQAADAAGIPAIWWYGSNGSVFGCQDPSAEKRLASQRAVIDYICGRHFIGVICPYSMEIYQRYGVPPQRMRLVPSVFDADLFTPPKPGPDERVSARLRVKYKVPEKAFLMGTIGNTPNSKGGDDVLRALALLKDEMPDLYYLILHTPEANLNKTKAISPDKKRIGKSEWDVLQDSKALAEKLGVKERVRFIGARFPREAMPMFYRLLDLYCSPSKAENLGQPLVESQLCGCTLVTYKGFSFDFVACPETAQQVEPSGRVVDDYGLIIPECDPRELANAIRRARAGRESDPATPERTRLWTTRKFHHSNARVMLDAIEEYGRLLNAR